MLTIKDIPTGTLIKKIPANSIHKDGIDRFGSSSTCVIAGAKDN